MSYFGKGLPKLHKKLNLLFFRTQSLFMDIVIKKKTGTGTSYLIRLSNMFNAFFVVHELANCDLLLQRGF